MSDTPGLEGKTVFVTGASRGIGLAIALRAAQDGANIVIAAKSTQEHPKLPGTIYTAAAEIEAAGGRALPLQVDIRSEEQVARAVEQAAATFGGIDILVNNASAISLTTTRDSGLRLTRTLSPSRMCCSREVSGPSGTLMLRNSRYSS